MRHVMTTRRDLENWVDDQTSNWLERREDDIQDITNAILARPDCPNWGQDWSEFLIAAAPRCRCDP